MTFPIINLTPHPVTIIRPATEGGEPVRTEYPACAPSELPRATEGNTYTYGNMSVLNAGSTTKGTYANAQSMSGTGVVDFIGYTGVEGLPPLSDDDLMFGVKRFYIVSIVTAIGAIAGGRGIEDLLVPCGQVRDAQGRIIGATGLASATSLFTPMVERLMFPPNKPKATTVADQSST